jgi:phenylacetic acid degradation operon negative regulatory protein
VSGLTVSVTAPAPVSAPGGPARAANRGSARSALLDVLGEFALSGGTQTPRTSTLVRVLTETGVGQQAARQAIHRCAQGGWLTGVRDGRESRWALTPAGRELLSDGIARVEVLGADVARWDGTWLVVVSSIPQARRSVRDRFYVALRWNGFGSPMPGLWISAHPSRQQSVADAISRCGLADSTAAFVGRFPALGMSERTLVDQAWPLDPLAERYRELVARFSQLTPHGPAESLIALLGLDGELQEIPSWDPHLPAALAPGWPGRAAAARLLALRAAWLDAARERWHELYS